MRDILVVPYNRERHYETLASWRGSEEQDYEGKGVVTAVAEHSGKAVASLTGTMAVLLSNFLKNPERNVLELASALTLLTRAVEFHAAQNGAVEGLTVVSDSLLPFQRLIERGGYRKVSLVGHTLFGIDLITRDKGSTL